MLQVMLQQMRNLVTIHWNLLQPIKIGQLVFTVTN